MTVLRNQSEKQLIPYLEELRQKKENGWALWLRLPQIRQDNQEAILERIARVADQVAVYGENMVYILCNGDVVIVSEQIYKTHKDRLIKEITPLLDPEGLADKKSPLCMSYTTSDELKELSLQVAELRRNKIAATSAPIGAASELLNPALFYHAIAQRKARKNICIMVVEDQRFSCKLVVDIITRQFRLECMVAENGVDALYLYEAYAPDIVFLDIDLPNISGQSVLQRITAVDGDSFVVMLTASQIQEDVERALKNGAMGYIVKPFSKQKIDRYINLYREHFVARGTRSA